jgi:hypothetical protein
MQVRDPDPAVFSAARHALSLVPQHVFDREGVCGLDELDEADEEEDYDKLHRKAEILEKQDVLKGVSRWKCLIASRGGGAMTTSQGGDARKRSLVPPIVTRSCLQLPKYPSLDGLIARCNLLPESRCE